VLAAAAAMAVAAAGCGGSSPAAKPAATRTPAALRAPLAGCDGLVAGWKPLRLALNDNTEAATLGRGPAGVVFANDSGGSACGWIGFAQDLARAGHPVAVTDGPGATERMLAAAVALRVAGARSVVLVGASVGGRAVLQAASLQPDAVAGVVSLSGERTVPGDPKDVLPTARHIRLPVLLVGSRQDGYTKFGADTRALHRAVPAKVNWLLLLSGGDHGVDLLSDEHAGVVRNAIERFLILRTTPGPS
jgi:pimeloyl-ACP methyl ester carboxylesterase